MAGYDNDDYEDHFSPRTLARWVPACVVLLAFGGFVALAWYAYHSGAQSMREEDLAVVEADKTPLKEKPLDPGGMKFPNQDKTIFETFAGNQPPPKVERVLPKPEEPVARQQPDNSDTKTFINENLQHPKTDEVKLPPIVTEQKTTVAAEPVKEIPIETKPQEQAVAQEKPAAGKGEDKTQLLSTPTPAKPHAETKPDKPKVVMPPTAAGKDIKIQLAAFSSEKEARDTYAKWQKKFPDLAGRAPLIIRADLGAKGVYWRVRLTGFASSQEAKAFCAKLTAKGQACILVTE